jgi:hypothetical protein
LQNIICETLIRKTAFQGLSLNRLTPYRKRLDNHAIGFYLVIMFAGQWINWRKRERVKREASLQDYSGRRRLVFRCGSPIRSSVCPGGGRGGIRRNGKPKTAATAPSSADERRPDNRQPNAANA